MGTEHQVPSKDFWTITPFRFTTPDGWVARQTIDHLVFMHVAGNEDINCGITWRRVAPGIDLRRTVQINSLAMRKQFPDANIVLSRFGRLRDRVAYMRVSELTHPDHGPYGQVYSAFYGPFFGGDRPLELFELTGWCPVDDDEHLREITRTIESFRFLLASVERADDDVAAKGA